MNPAPDAEQKAMRERGGQLHFELTGRVLREGEYPCQDAIWQLMQEMRETDQAVTELLNDY